ncbi:hypothetical protein [Tolypothrix sp. VBCCA 56010]|uniref:hypothetical protein n=1 Tax=Tolypothrix sp. VBCCA 56010 TaxID=3137731 RepID=UPI003D7DE3F8
MGNGEWGRLDAWTRKRIITNDARCFKPGNPSNALAPQCPMPNAQCPMPNAQCPITNALCPMPNAQLPIIGENDVWVTPTITTGIDETLY